MTTLQKAFSSLVLASLALLALPASAAHIEVHGVFTVDVTADPQATGSGFFDIRSPFWNPNAGPDEDPTPGTNWDVLDFEFTFEGVTWDESDVDSCECYFDEFGEPLAINFFSDGPKGLLRLSWSFEDGNFGFEGGGFSGTSENGEVSGPFESLTGAIVPEPGTLLLMSVGLVGFGAGRRQPRPVLRVAA